VFRLREFNSEDKIVKVSQNDMTIIAFDRISQGKVGAIAVVDRDSGRLLANFSATDLMVIKFGIK
jgi:CBS domain-containing protein